MRCNHFMRLFCVQIRKMEDIKMSEAMENVTENTPAEKTEETKAEKFIRLGEYRINKAIDVIGRIENLANHCGVPLEKTLSTKLPHHFWL